MVGVFGSLYALIYYGSYFWLGFVACMFILDMIGFLILDITDRLDHRIGLILLLAVECSLISMPFIYWAVEYDYYLWYVLITAFWLSQFIIRLNKIHRIVLVSNY